MPATGPANPEAVPLPWSIADPADDDVSESRSLPAVNSVDHTTWRPVSHDCNTWLQGDGSLESLERLPAVKTEVAPVGGCAARTGCGSGTSGSDWQEFCRICHDGGERAPLIVACRCTGSMQHVHNVSDFVLDELHEDDVELIQLHRCEHDDDDEIILPVTSPSDINILTSENVNYVRLVPVEQNNSLDGGIKSSLNAHKNTKRCLGGLDIGLQFWCCLGKMDFDE